MAGVSYLREDFSVPCGTSRHNAHVLIAVIVLVAFCIGFPLATGVMLYRHYRAETLDQESTRKRLLFLLDGYKPERAYWESAVLMRKLGLVAIASVMRSDPSMQLYAGIALLLTASGVQLVGDPFEEPDEGRLENLSLFVGSVSLYAGLLFYLDGASEFWKELFGVLLVLANIGFVALCGAAVLADVWKRRVQRRLQVSAAKRSGRELTVEPKNGIALQQVRTPASAASDGSNPLWHASRSQGGASSFDAKRSPADV